MIIIYVNILSEFGELSMVLITFLLILTQKFNKKDSKV